MPAEPQIIAAESISEIMDVSHLLTHVVKHAWGMLIVLLPKIIAGMLIFLFFMVLSHLFNNALKRLATRTPESRAPVIHFLRSIVRVAMIVVGAITALGSAGLEVSALVASLGLSGVAVSFALKDMLSNVVAGIMVMLYQPYRIGSTIQVGSDIGKVTGLNIRYTNMVTSDGSTIIIPNAKMLTETIRLPSASSRSGTE
jgi:small-conductance mechanosensitive channel